MAEQYDDIIEITPKDKTFIAIKFTGVLTDALKDVLDELDLKFTDDLEGYPEQGTRCFIDGDLPEDTVAIFPDDYFVQFGPFWDVLSEREFSDEFTVDII